MMLLGLKGRPFTRAKGKAIEFDCRKEKSNRL